jgi:hemolysin III
MGQVQPVDAAARRAGRGIPAIMEGTQRPPERRPMNEVPQSHTEEVANAVSHALGCLLAIAAAPILVVEAVSRGLWSAVGGIVFASTMVVLYLASAAYHAAPAGAKKLRLQKADHCAIYLLIAGTYTPFMLGALRGAWGWSLLGAIWLLAALGVVFKLTIGLNYPRFSVGLYIAMGWLVMSAIRPMWEHVPLTGIVLLIAGGLFYTVGVFFYMRRDMRYAHLVWHLFVLAGTACHYFAVLGYSA